MKEELGCEVEGPSRGEARSVGSNRRRGMGGAGMEGDGSAYLR